MVSGVRKGLGVIQWDYAVLYFFNRLLTFPGLDHFWLFITDLHKIDVVRFGVAPAFVIWFFYKYRLNALGIVGCFGASIGMADAFAYRLIKPYFERQRPVHNLEIAEWLRPVGDAHGFSFPSNHAANCFAGALILAHFFPRYRYFFYTFALIIALSRVSLGVHYPSDILAGGVLGSACAWLVVALYTKYVSQWNAHSLSAR